MTLKTLGLSAALLLSVLHVAESKADEKREQAKRELLSRPVFQNNLTPEAHLRSGSVPPVNAELTASNSIRSTGEQEEARTPASEVGEAPAFVNENQAPIENEVQAPEVAVEREVNSVANPFVWILPLIGLFAVSFYFVKRRK